MKNSSLLDKTNITQTKTEHTHSDLNQVWTLVSLHLELIFFLIFIFSATMMFEQVHVNMNTIYV